LTFETFAHIGQDSIVSSF